MKIRYQGNYTYPLQAPRSDIHSPPPQTHDQDTVYTSHCCKKRKRHLRLSNHTNPINRLSAFLPLILWMWPQIVSKSLIICPVCLGIRRIFVGLFLPRHISMWIFAKPESYIKIVLPERDPQTRPSMCCHQTPCKPRQILSHLWTGD